MKQLFGKLFGTIQKVPVKPNPMYKVGDRVINLLNNEKGVIEDIDGGDCLVKPEHGFSRWVLESNLERATLPKLAVGSFHKFMYATMASHHKYIGQEVMVLDGGPDHYTVNTPGGVRLHGIYSEQLETAPSKVSTKSTIEIGDVVRIMDPANASHGRTATVVHVDQRATIISNPNFKTKYAYGVRFPEGNTYLYYEEQVTKVEKEDIKEEIKPKLIWDDLSQEQRAAFVKKVIESMYMDKELCPKINSLLK